MTKKEMIDYAINLSSNSAVKRKAAMRTRKRIDARTNRALIKILALKTN